MFSTLSNNNCNDFDLQEKMHAFETTCRQAGLKVTPQRLAIYEVLIGSDEHPSAGALFQKVKKVIGSISLDTVNRTLLTFAEIGAAFIVEGSGEVKRFDANLKTHQHFKCTKCKSIIDLHCWDLDEIKVPDDIAEKFTVLRKTVYLEGICDVCKKA